jgi:hypothetical protein
MDFIFGAVSFALAIWAVYNVVTSDATTLTKFGWVVGIVILPVIGVIAWFFLGPNGPGARRR